MTYFPVWILFSKHYSNVKKTNTKIEKDEKKITVEDTSINKLKFFPFF